MCVRLNLYYVAIDLEVMSKKVKDGYNIWPLNEFITF